MLNEPVELLLINIQAVVIKLDQRATKKMATTRWQKNFTIGLLPTTYGKVTVTGMWYVTGNNTLL
jgi:hypothetical protein